MRRKVCGAETYSDWNPEMGLHLKGEFSEWPDVFHTDERGLTFLKGHVALKWIELGLAPLVLTALEDMKPYDYHPPPDSTLRAQRRTDRLLQDRAGRR
jgi:hypothetical protein